MTIKTYVFSDPHFGHKNILNFTDENSNKIRPLFDNVNHMDEYMIDKINSTIKPSDRLICLGDFSFNKTVAKNVLSKIECSHFTLVRGNHDKFKAQFYLDHGFDEVLGVKNYNDHGIVMSHYPIHPNSLWQHRKQRDMINVHGHIHQNSEYDYRYINVSVENLDDYTPIDLEELIEKANDRRKEYGNYPST